MRLATIVVGITQGVACLVFFGVVFSDESKTVYGSDVYLSALFGALVELPA